MCGHECPREQKVRAELELYKNALAVAAEALSIASDWNVDEVEIENMPVSLGLESEDNMYSTYELANKLKQIAKRPMPI